MTNEKFCRLLEKLMDNDMSALKAVYEEYFQMMRYTALGITKDDGDAYDVATNVILKLRDYPSDPRAVRNHVGLLISMTKHEALNLVRRRGFVCPFDDYAEEASAGDGGGELWMQDILEALTREEREVFTAHVVWGRPLREISRESGIPYRTVVRIYAAVKAKIKQLYSP